MQKQGGRGRKAPLTLQFYDGLRGRSPREGRL